MSATSVTRDNKPGMSGKRLTQPRLSSESNHPSREPIHEVDPAGSWKPAGQCRDVEYWADCKVVEGSRFLANEQMGRRLWTVSEEFIAAHVGPT